jgi:tetratricopeptide (TPR) repeat protein
MNMRVFTLLLTTVLWSGPIGAAEPDARPVPTMEQRTEAFVDVTAAMESGNKAAAADGLIAITESEEWAMFHAESYARLAVLLNKLDLPYSALIAYSKALSADPEGVGSEAGKAVDLADKVGDQAILEPVFASNIGLDVDEATRSRMAYLAARENYRNGNLAIAGAMLKMVKPNDPYYPEAKALEGVVLSLQDRHGNALAPFQIALATGGRAQRSDLFKATVTLNLARAYYAAGNFPQAAHYWSQIERDDPKWLDAQFERAWAHFRMEDMNGTLGLLQNHVSPYFQDRYYPEAAMLRLYALFMLCKFPDASAQLEAFQKQYRPQQSELLGVTAYTGEDAFDQIRRHIADGSSDLPKMVTLAFENEDRIKDSIGAVTSAEEEIARLRNVGANVFAQSAMEWVNERRSEVVKTEGTRIVNRVKKMEAQLSEMIANSDVTKLDLMQMETRLFERASFTGKLPEAKRMVKRQVRARVTERKWDWQGEFWADEVGYYRVDTTPECPANMMQGG